MLEANRHGRNEGDETLTVWAAVLGLLTPLVSGTETLTISGNQSYDPACGGATLTIADDDGVTARAANPLRVARGETATYTVVLERRPAADVTVTPFSTDPALRDRDLG